MDRIVSVAAALIIAGPVAAQNSNQAGIDTVVAARRVIDIRVGKTVDLLASLDPKALNAKGEIVPKARFQIAVVVGADRASITGDELTARAPGTAVVAISAICECDPPGTPPRRVTQVLVNISP